MFFDRLFDRRGRHRRKREAAAAYVTIVDAARRPQFFTEIGVPDTIDGRFDLVVLHAFLVLDRLQWTPANDSMVDNTIESFSIEPDDVFAQALFDHMFADMDYNLREMGVGDLSVGKRVRKMAEAFYGRALNYQRALDSNDPETLADALRRNLFGTVANPSPAAVDAMVSYMRAGRAALRTQESAVIRAAQIRFPEPPQIESGQDRVAMAGRGEDDVSKHMG